MARKSFAKKLSFLLTVSMLASSLSPAVVSAAETDGMAEQIVSETEEAVGTEESETERPDIQDSDMGNQDEAPVPKLPENETRKMRAARVMSDGINDAWDQDKNTIVGTAATNEIYNNIWLHLKADASNGNSGLPPCYSLLHSSGGNAEAPPSSYKYPIKRSRLVPLYKYCYFCNKL